ncbi:hypothetical protein [Vineibacter terrae]|uniref:hypothetical protein n=1 Tax=Vineibacter terrae TaxID=2586908 RepID=UPI002E334942|nr:hypothetical protein [Vineibacter terrae]HEX2890712.1 hypothetical protein [Vineibacter terrae]
MTLTKTRKAPASTVTVDYRIVDGWHVFTSDQVKGLYVAHEDCRTAYDAVAPTIEALLSENEKVEVKVQPGTTVDRFLAYLKTRVLNLPLRPGRRDFVVTAAHK